LVALKFAAALMKSMWKLVSSSFSNSAGVKSLLDTFVWSSSSYLESYAITSSSSGAAAPGSSFFSSSSGSLTSIFFGTYCLTLAFFANSTTSYSLPFLVIFRAVAIN
jgi:hypothetical protein